MSQIVPPGKKIRLRRVTQGTFWHARQKLPLPIGVKRDHHGQDEASFSSCAASAAGRRLRARRRPAAAGGAVSDLGASGAEAHRMMSDPRTENAPVLQKLIQNERRRFWIGLILTLILAAPFAFVLLLSLAHLLFGSR